MNDAQPLPTLDRAEIFSVPSRYDRVAAWLHWTIGAALVGQIAFGFLLDNIAPRGTQLRASTINLHKSFGICLGLAIALRIGWRVLHSPPPFDTLVPVWQSRSARSVHLALYLCMAAMPLSGYIASNFSAHGIRFFGHWLPPWGPNLPRVYEILTSLHQATGYVFAGLIALHVFAALRHFYLGDGVLERMRVTGARPRTTT